jgi:hypothetical protein
LFLDSGTASLRLRDDACRRLTPGLRAEVVVKDKKRKKERRRVAKQQSAERKSDRLTAAHVSGRIEQVLDELGDLIYEFRYMKRFSELEDIAMITWRLDLVREKCQKFADDGSWDG